MREMKIIYLVFALVIGLNIDLDGQNHAGALSNNDDLQLFRSIVNEDKLYHYVEVLASVEFEGRLTGHEGYDKAAEWVVGKFKEFGIQPLGENGSYLQHFPHPYTEVYEGCEVKLHGFGGDEKVLKSYEYVEEFIPGSTSGNGEITAEAIYVGYGISAPELNYDDYAGLDVSGKIIILEREVPVKTSHEEFQKWRPYSFHQYKLKNAVAHGAAGMLYNYHIANPNNAYKDGFIYAHIGDSVMADLFRDTGKEPDSIVYRIKEELKPQSFSTGKTVSIKINSKHHPEGVGSNVLGYIGGSDPELKNEFILMGGHLDHLGRCYTIMPGANDNASAVSVTLGIAEALSRSRVKLKRTVVFVFLGAEEAGLKGVQYFLKNPTTGSLDQIKGYINMDGVGIGEEIHVQFAENYPQFYSYLEAANSQDLNHVLKGLHSSNVGRPRLDAAFFDWYGIPVLSIYTMGAREIFQGYRYHTPHDNISNIQPEIMMDLAGLLYLSVIDLANADELKFKRGELRGMYIE